MSLRVTHRFELNGHFFSATNFLIRYFSALSLSHFIVYSLMILL